MNENFTRLTASAHLPRLLIADNRFSTVEPLLRTFADRRLDVDFEVCTSAHTAIQKLLAFPYQLIICGAHLAELDDFLLLKHTQGLDAFTPLIVTAATPEKESARRVLKRGAFDLIALPPDHEQTVRTIRLALWQRKLTDLIARKENAHDRYHQHLSDYPEDRSKFEASFNKALAAFENTISSVERTILLIEESTVSFLDLATKLEYEARQQALERLDGGSQ